MGVGGFCTEVSKSSLRNSSQGGSILVQNTLFCMILTTFMNKFDIAYTMKITAHGQLPYFRVIIPFPDFTLQEF